MDDNRTNRTILADMLLAWGFAPTTARDGAEALSICEGLTCGSSFQLAILDMMMPGMSGLELAGEIRKRPALQDVRLIMLTSLDGPEDMLLARQVSISAYLVKPVRQSKLLDTIASAMGVASQNVDPVMDEASGRFEGSSVLLVEDHPINQEVGKAMLEHRDVWWKSPPTAGSPSTSTSADHTTLS